MLFVAIGKPAFSFWMVVDPGSPHLALWNICSKVLSDA